MPDLSQKAASKYWFEFMDPSIYRVITYMESVEDFTLDGDPALEEALEQLGKELDNMEGVNINNIQKQELFIRIVGNIKTGRGLRLLQAIDSIQPGSASQVLVHAEDTSMSEDDPAGIFLKRNIAFERFRLLSRIFSEERLRLVTEALEGDD